MKCKITLEIQNLHACLSDQTTKAIEIPEDVFSQVEVLERKEQINEELAYESEREKAEKKRRVKIEPLIAFKEVDGEIRYRIGGPYGKLAGLFKDAGSALYSMKIEGFKSAYKSFIKSLIIKPQFVTLQECEDIDISTIPQITAGRSKALIIFYYEYIPRCIVEMTVQVPDGERDKFETLLEQAEGMPFGPKRRGEIKVENIEWDT